ncbi:unnamed protein product [Ectocarpus sp. CCAP 1310/34]|nr:unnamed protein product [Ectocarpus sp. CCAP 1310/34]
MAPTTTAAGGSDGGGGPNALEHGAKNNEVKFGKHLASSDKRVRDRTVGALREWLRQRSRGGSLTDLDLLKIWRGLWYCMFMCDKAPVQRELAENLAGLLSLFKDDRAEGVRFFKSFCVTMQRDWERIDNLRIDKYYTLVRVFVREALAFCRLPPQAVGGQPKQKRKKKGKKNSPAEEAETCAKAGGVWDLGLLGAMSEVMEVEILTLRPAPIGLRLHLADVWAEEACNAGGADMPTEAFLVALAPWLRVAAEPETNPVVFRRTFEGVFEGLLGLFPEDKDGMEEEEEEEKKVFAAVELDRVQACLFEVAAAPQTRDKRRVKLYELHRRYQKRTGVAPDASAPPSGILPLPDESDDDEDEEGGGDGEYVEAGARRRAVRGPEPAVAGWVAAGIASGDISLEGGAEGGGKKAKKRRKRSGSEDDEAEVNGGGEKKRRTVEEEEEEEEASAKKMKKKSRGSVEKDSAEAAAAGAPAAAPAGVEAGAGGKAEAVTPGKKSTKKRKKEEASPPGGAPNGAVTMEGTVVAAAAVGDGVSSPPSSGKRKKKKRRGGSADGVATVVGDDAAAAVSTATAAAPEAGAAAGNGGDVSSPPRSGKRKKNKERVSADGVATDASDVAAAAVSLATAAAPEAEAAAPADGVEESPSSGKKKKKKKGKGEEEVAMPDEGESETTPEDDVTTTPDSSSEKKKKKKKKKRPSLEAVASPTPPPGNTASEEDSAPSSGSFQTPPKNAGGGGGSSSKKKKKSPAAGESARKTVTFGANMAKEHQTSVKDLKTRVITPSKDAGTPQKGLLKVGGGGSGVKLMKPAAGRKDTPFAGKKKASDYF